MLDLINFNNTDNTRQVILPVSTKILSGTSNNEVIREENHVTILSFTVNELVL